MSHEQIDTLMEGDVDMMSDRDVLIRSSDLIITTISKALSISEQPGSGYLDSTSVQATYIYVRSFSVR